MDAYDIGGCTVDRRLLIRLAAAGLVALPGAGLAGCATGGDDQTPAAGGPSTSKNPFGVKEDAALEFYNFEGGYGKEWTTLPLDLYRKDFPKASVKLSSGQQLQQQLQPRFVQGDVPDLIENVGLDTAALVSQNQLLPLEPLLKAPAYDIAGKTVEQSLLPGAGATGIFGGTKYAQAYVLGLSGIWYSQSLMRQRGWEYPKTWDEMMSLCAKIKAAGIAPWTYQGQYAGYILNPIQTTAEKTGGSEVGKAIDNLEPNAWRHDAVVAAASRFHELAAKGYLLEGTTALSHTQSQTYWAERKAVFIPCGSWLENELGSIAPADLEMAVAPTPSLSSTDKLPFEAIMGGASGELIIPARAKNPQGGMELLRILLGQESSTNFTKLTKSLTCLAGYADSISMSSGLKSVNDAARAAGKNLLPVWSFTGWYAKMQKEIEGATTALMSNSITPDEWSKRCQKAADDTAKDSAIKKYRR